MLNVVIQAATRGIGGVIVLALFLGVPALAIIDALT